jgi:hypothetical protein
VSWNATVHEHRLRRKDANASECLIKLKTVLYRANSILSQLVRKKSRLMEEMAAHGTADFV